VSQWVTRVCFACVSTVSTSSSSSAHAVFSGAFSGFRRFCLEVFTNIAYERKLDGGLYACVTFRPSLVPPFE